MTATLTRADPAMRPLFGSNADLRHFKVEPGRLPDNAEIRLLARVRVERVPITELEVVGEPEPCNPEEVVDWEPDDPDAFDYDLAGEPTARTYTLADELIAEGTILDHDPMRWQPYRALVELGDGLLSEPDYYLVEWR